MTEEEERELRDIILVWYDHDISDRSAAKELGQWLDRKEPEGEYTAACVELVERLAAEAFACDCGGSEWVVNPAKELVARKPTMTSAEAQGE